MRLEAYQQRAAPSKSGLSARRCGGEIIARHFFFLHLCTRCLAHICSVIARIDSYEDSKCFPHAWVERSYMPFSVARPSDAKKTPTLNPEQRGEDALIETICMCHVRLRKTHALVWRIPLSHQSVLSSSKTAALEVSPSKLPYGGIIKPRSLVSHNLLPPVCDLCTCCRTQWGMYVGNTYQNNVRSYTYVHIHLHLFVNTRFEAICLQL